MTLGERLKKTRMAKGLNLTEAAKELGVARTAYRLWEKEAATPAPEAWSSIAVWCEVPVPTMLREVGLLRADEETALLELASKELRKRARETGKR